MNTLNVFEHQRFLVRRPPDREHPRGQQLRLSWRQIMTGADEPLWFDYPIEYFNVAALGLCAALTQAVLEPETLDDLAARLQSGVADDEIESRIGPLRDLFTIDGNVRFLQGAEPSRDKKGPLSELLLTMTKGDKEILNRPDSDAVVALDQVPLLLFSRTTFYQKSAGRGYLTGTSGDLEIRTFLVDPQSLRRTIWLNVLTREQQAKTNMFTPQGDLDGYDRWMWSDPPEGDVPQGALSLRAGLFWMVANAFVEISDISEARPCIVTGDLLTGRVGTGVVVASTGKGYGVKVAREKGPEVRMSFFHHPNGPWQTIVPSKGAPFDRHLSVGECSGLIGQMAGLFFSSGHEHHVAPVIQQLYAMHLHKIVDHSGQTEILCFGFHMLSSKQNVHGGYEIEQYRYPILGAQDDDPDGALRVAEGIMNGAAERTGKIEWILKRAVQMCLLKEIDTESQEDGTLVFKEKKKIDEGGVMRDSSTELWGSAGRELPGLVVRIGETGGKAETLENASDELLNWWTDSIVLHAEEIFRRIFDDYSSSPQHLAAAHNARRLFNGALYKLDQGIFARRRKTTAKTNVEEITS